MKLKGNNKSKKTKLSLKYNVQKRVREHRRRVKKEARKLGIKKRTKKDPGIPNSWPFKAEMLADLERQKAERDKEMEKRRLDAKQKSQEDRKTQADEKWKVEQERAAARRQKRAEEIVKRQKEALRSVLARADVILVALDSRDPFRCRCEALEAWAQEKGKRFIFVLTKADLVPPQVTAQWLQVLGRVGPVVSVQVEAGREGLPELLQMLGHAPGASSQPPADSVPAAPAPAAAVGILGFPQTGKRLLRKAIYHSISGPVPWMLDRVGKLCPTPQPFDAATALHLTIRGAAPQRADAVSEDEPLAMVEHLLQRISQQVVMRRFRLPSFEGTEGFLRAFAKDRQIKNKNGNDPRVETIAKRFLPELTTQPGCFCLPPGTAPEKEAALWPAHAAARPQIEAVMLAQVGVLKSRAEGPTAGALTLSSAGLGPAVDLADTLAALDVDAEMSAEEGDEDDEDGDGEGEESEEELIEGEESGEGDGDGDEKM